MYLKKDVQHQIFIFKYNKWCFEYKMLIFHFYDFYKIFVKNIAYVQIFM